MCWQNKLTDIIIMVITRWPLGDPWRFRRILRWEKFRERSTPVGQEFRYGRSRPESTANSIGRRLTEVARLFRSPPILYGSEVRDRVWPVLEYHTRLPRFLYDYRLQIIKLLEIILLSLLLLVLKYYNIITVWNIIPIVSRASILHTHIAVFRILHLTEW